MGADGWAADASDALLLADGLEAAMTYGHAGAPGLAMVCDFDGKVTEVPWDDLGAASEPLTRPHFACVLRPGFGAEGSGAVPVA